MPQGIDDGPAHRRLARAGLAREQQDPFAAPEAGQQLVIGPPV